MDVLFILVISCLILGCAVGVMAGLLGIGGGLIIVPVLTYLLAELLKIAPQETIVIAIATSLSTIIFTGISSARAYYRLGYTVILFFGADWVLAQAPSPPQIANAIPGSILKLIFACLVIAIALYMLFGRRVESNNSVTKPKLATIGMLTGTLSALMGIGGGALLVPRWFGIVLTYAKQLVVRRLVASLSRASAAALL